MYEINLASDNLKMTEEIGRIVGLLLPYGSVIALTGPLAAGKTAISRAIFAARGYSAHFCSPSYTIINEYVSNGKTAYHMDVFRLADESELDYTGYDDCLKDSELTVIEWADMIAGRVPKGALNIQIALADDANKRRLTVGTDDKMLYDALKEALHAYTCD